MAARMGFPGMGRTGGLAPVSLPAVDQRLAPQTSWRACSLQAASANSRPEMKILKPVH